MNRIEYFTLFVKIFEYKIISDKHGNEFVVFKDSRISSVGDINDKTEFEALENHIHLINNIKKHEYESSKQIARNLSLTVLRCLQIQFPHKHFRVYVSVQLYGSMIIRFHQQWANETPYYDVDSFTSPKERIYLAEN